METIYSQLQANKEQLGNLKQLGYSLNFKAAGTMVAGNVTGSTITHIDPQLMSPNLIKAENSSFVMDYFPRIMCESHSLVIVDETSDDTDGTFSSVAENAAKEQIDFDNNATQKSFTKYADYIKVSDEMVTDIPFLMAQIDTKLRKKLKNKISADFVAALVAATPNVVNTSLTVGQLATKLRHLFPSIYEGMKSLKGYDMNLWLLNTPNYGQVFNDVDVSVDDAWFDLMKPTIIPANITAGNIMALDTSMFPIYVYKDIDVQIGKTNDDFSKNLVTVRAETRVAWNIAGECLNAFYDDVISTTVTRI